MKYAVAAVIAAIVFASLYAGQQAVRSWRAAASVRMVRLQRD